METRNICVQMPTDKHKRLKLYCVQNDTCIAALLESLVNGFLREVAERQTAISQECNDGTTSEP